MVRLWNNDIYNMKNCCDLISNLKIVCKPLMIVKGLDGWSFQATMRCHFTIVTDFCKLYTKETTILGIAKLGNHQFMQWLIACSAPNHYLSHCWLIYLLVQIYVKFISERNVFIHKIAFWYTIREMTFISLSPQCVKDSTLEFNFSYTNPSTSWYVVK